MSREKDQALDHGVQTLTFTLSDAGGPCRGLSPGVARGPVFGMAHIVLC